MFWSIIIFFLKWMIFWFIVCIDKKKKKLFLEFFVYFFPFFLVVKKKKSDCDGREPCCGIASYSFLGLTMILNNSRLNFINLNLSIGTKHFVDTYSKCLVSTKLFCNPSTMEQIKLLNQNLRFILKGIQLERLITLGNF